MELFFTSKKYKYWEKIDSEFSFRLIRMNMDDMEKSQRNLIDCLSEKKEELNRLKQSKMELAGNDSDMSALVGQLYELESQIRQLQAKGRNQEEKLIQYSRVGHIKIAATRLKDSFTCKEALAVEIFENNMQQGKIVTTLAKLPEDIYKLEQYGLYLQAPYADELAKIIGDYYYDMNSIMQEYIENDIPEKVIEEFVRICVEAMRSDMEKYRCTSKGVVFYDIVVSELRNIHNDSIFRRYSLTDIKEALSIYGYSCCNFGRNDYTKAKVGKVIRLYSDKVERLLESEHE